MFNVDKINTMAKKVNPDIAKERKKCTFDVEEMACWWNNGAQKLKEKREREQFFLNDPELNDKVPYYFKSHTEKYEESVRKAVVICRKIKELQDQGKDGVDNYMALLGGLLGSGLIEEGNPLSVHYVMFLPALMGHGTTMQQAEWMSKAWTCQIVGTYAQTELGHGTFIRGLETTATYDPATKEFVLNSPTLTSLKWWPGGLGHTANYCIVIAQLWSKGKCHGIHPFIVQLRDEETHMPLPGIQIGEIGAKLGFNTVNNGYLGFKNVRIPREQMLMKNAKITEDGEFIKPKASVLTYGTMMFVRVVIIRDMASYLSKAVTIAIRYSCVRRQSQINPKEPEIQIIDHVTQQNKLFVPLASVMAFKVASDYLWDLYNQVTHELEGGNLDRLPELHAIACCLKAVCTADTAKYVEACRLACGGHGYLHCSGFPATYAMVTAASTYEGENTVLLLQTARYLVKMWSEALNGRALVPTVAYLEHAVKNNGQKVKWDQSFAGMIAALQGIAAGKLKNVFGKVEVWKSRGLTQEEAANKCSIELASTADAHCRAFLVQSSYVMINQACRDVSPALGDVLKHIIELFAVDTCIKSLADLQRYTTITETDINNLQTTLENLLAKIRPNAVSIVDGFDIPDKVLGSALGVYDGNVYEKLFEEAQKSPMNQEPVNKSFHLYLKPFMKSNL
ncbi:probable peroxisomal acyl-coenzyme A oxidase 1 [Culicoides brevitarsis]|uniref:probable peroxisomal acyl-coenzyme A oxidase 1 n=1 Tax=Culicoides brevitarsis TaxID=469753 RepID=UPI00307B4A98